MGGGVALFDYDHDGWLDIFLVNGSSFDPKVRDRKPTSYLFHNNRDGTFTDVTEKAGLTHSGWGQGCCVGDYDNDGFDDLFVSYWGRNVLYRNNGDGTFTDVSEKAGVAGAGHRVGRRLLFPGLRLATASSTSSSPATSTSSPTGPRAPGTMPTAATTRSRCPAVRSATPAAPTCSIAIAATARSKMCRRRPASRVPAVRRRWCSSAATGARRDRTGWARRQRISTMTAGRTSTSRATRRRASCTGTITMERSARWRSRPGARSTRPAPRSPAWASV